MKKTVMTHIVMLSILLLVSSCVGTRYGKLTTRVKSKLPVEKAEKKNRDFSTLQGTIKLEPKSFDVTSHVYHPNKNKLEFEVTPDEETAVVSAEKEKTNQAAAAFGKDEYHQPKDTITSGDSDIEFRKAQYEKANRLAKLGLGFTIGILVPAIGFFLFVFGYITTIRAFRIYRQYENPGVEEKFKMAKWTFIISTILIAAGLATLGYLYLLFFGL